MTEPTPNRAASEAVDLLQQEHELHKMARHAFEHGGDSSNDKEQPR